MKYSKELIAYIQGIPIQYKRADAEEWIDLIVPEEDSVQICLSTWKSGIYEFRIKPQILYYRTALVKDETICNNEDNFCVVSYTFNEVNAKQIKQFNINDWRLTTALADSKHLFPVTFIKWLNEITSINSLKCI